MPSDVTTGTGEAMFARYAYPPNELGYCGDGDGRELLEFADAAGSESLIDLTASAQIRRRARSFDGALPYLEYLADVAGLDDPMARPVVEAYWVGNGLLHRADRAGLESMVRRSFGHQSAVDWAALAPGVDPIPLPHHAFHVFSVYPWVGVLRRTGSARALAVLDSCRIRWGRVDWVDGGQVQVQCQPLTWNGNLFRLGAPRPEHARLTSGGRSLSPMVSAGQWVSLHWDWVCDTLDEEQLKTLREATARQLALTNRTI